MKKHSSSILPIWTDWALSITTEYTAYCFDIQKYNILNTLLNMENLITLIVDIVMSTIKNIH